MEGSDVRKICLSPFKKIEVDINGDAWLCCSDWLPTPIGNLFNNSFNEVWNSPIAKEIRKSAFDGTYKYCNKDVCPSLIQGHFDHVNRGFGSSLINIVENKIVELEVGPEDLFLSYDKTCNLKCETCRAEFIALKGEGFNRAEELQEKIFRDGLNNAKHVVVTGQGDPFASRLYRKLLSKLDSKKFPDLWLHFMTNGILFSPEIWKSMRKIRNSVGSMQVSIDAVTSETYNKIRRGGDFSKLKKSLKFISKLRKKRKFFWEISFVVQMENYKEMEEFINMGIEMGCDSVLFQRVLHWKSALPKDEYLKKAVHLKDHPEHKQFIKTLKKPIFKNEIVNMSNLEALLID